MANNTATDDMDTESVHSADSADSADSIHDFIEKDTEDVSENNDSCEYDENESESIDEDESDEDESDDDESDEDESDKKYNKAHKQNDKSESTTVPQACDAEYKGTKRRNENLDHIDASNIMDGPRRRKSTKRYEDDVFSSEEYLRMLMYDIPSEEIDAALYDEDFTSNEDDESDEDDSDEDSLDNGQVEENNELISSTVQHAPMPKPMDACAQTNKKSSDATKEAPSSKESRGVEPSSARSDAKKKSADATKEAPSSNEYRGVEPSSARSDAKKKSADATKEAPSSNE